jgi:hypothetical protein
MKEYSMSENKKDFWEPRIPDDWKRSKTEQPSTIDLKGQEHPLYRAKRLLLVSWDKCKEWNLNRKQKKQ